MRPKRHILWVLGSAPHALTSLRTKNDTLYEYEDWHDTYKFEQWPCTVLTLFIYSVLFFHKACFYWDLTYLTSTLGVEWVSMGKKPWLKQVLKLIYIVRSFEMSNHMMVPTKTLLSIKLVMGCQDKSNCMWRIQHHLDKNSIIISSPSQKECYSGFELSQNQIYRLNICMFK